MRKFLISLSVAASAVAIASPASAQFFPQPQGNAYGFNNNYGQTRRLQVRIDQIQRQIERLDRRNVLSNNEASRLFAESRDLERRLAKYGRHGLNFRERQGIEVRIVRLEQRVRYEATDGNRRAYNGYNQNGYNGYNQNGYNGYNQNAYNNQYAYDQDRDGRDDRYEDDRGRKHDDRNDDDDRDD